MARNDYVELEDVEIVKITNEAILIKYADESYWIPKSQIKEPEQFEEGQELVEIEIREWILEEKEII